jgi:hydrogenase maturation protein HypF
VSDGIKRVAIRLTGRVQGIGLRPTVLRLAGSAGLGGSVQNRSEGVLIEVEGSADSIDRFLKGLSEEFPGYFEMAAVEVAPRDERSFQIVASEKGGDPFDTDLPVDLALCGRCEEELLDPDNRRHLYPFISCARCGPRFAVLNALPYDREQTQYGPFAMCPECRSEYGAFDDRRLHAETTSCPGCGPQYVLLDNGSVAQYGKEAIRTAAGLLRSGEVVAIKSTGGFHLVCDATDELATSALRAIKRREKRPFAVMFRDLSGVRALFDIDLNAEQWLVSPARPVVILHGSAVRLAKGVSPDTDRTGVMLAHTGVYRLLFEEIDRPLVVTSANISDDPVVESYGELGRVSDQIRYALDHDLSIRTGIDDSVVRLENGLSIPIRLGRGLSPLPLRIPFSRRRRILACGADLKNTFAISYRERIIVSPHTGDNGSANSFERYQKNINNILKIYKLSPDEVVCDLHSGYRSSAFARSLNLPLRTVQHHHAHALSLMVDNDLGPDRRVPIAVFDGTGYGADGTLWGGEFLLAGYDGFERIGHLQTMLLIGGDRAVREGARTAASILFTMYGAKALEMETPPIRHLMRGEGGEGKISMLRAAHLSGTGILSSSVGRLFDAAASMLDLLHVSDYEGEAGMVLEKYYNPKIVERYPFTIENGIVSYTEMCDAMLREQDPVRGASRFINTIASMLIAIFESHGELGLTGGVFQNASLVARTAALAKEKKLRLYLHKRIPPNDGGISVGQAAWISPEDMEA